MLNDFTSGQYGSGLSTKAYLEGLCFFDPDMKEKVFNGVLELLYHKKNPVLCFKLGMSLREIEKMILMQTLRFCKCNQSKTARFLGVDSRTVYKKIRVYGLLDYLKDLEKEFGIVRRPCFENKKRKKDDQ